MIKSILHFFKLKKKKRKRLTYEDYIINSDANNVLGIKVVNNIELIKTLPLDESLYAEISLLIKSGNIMQVEKMAVDDNLLQDLALVTFNNQTGQPYAALVYDSYDAWQEPVIVEIFKL